MIPKKNTQLRLRVCEKEQLTCAGRFLPTVLALLATVVTIFSIGELTGLTEICSPLAMLLAGSGACVALGILTLVGKKKWFYSGVLLFVLIVTLIFGKQIVNGCALVWNQVGDTWTLKTGWVLPELAASADIAPWSLLLVSVLTGVLMATVCCALAQCRVPVLAILIPGALLAGMIAFRESAVFSGLLMTLAVSVLFLLYSGGVVGKKSLRGFFGRLLPAVLAGGILLAVATLPGVQNWAEDYREERQKNIHKRAFETAYTTLPEGNFSGFYVEENTEYPALVVNMEKPTSMYLRGFTGTEFDGTKWTPLDCSIIAQNKTLLYWLNLNAFYPDAQYEKAAAFLELEENTVTVQNIGACSAYRYVPYSMCANSSLRAENLNSNGVQAEGERIYLFSTVDANAEQISLLLEHLRTSQEKAVLQYRKAESAYRDFVYENYLQIPQEMMTLLQEDWDKTASRYGGVEELTFAQAQECVMEFLNVCFPEEGEQDQVKLPLQTLSGSSYQYATVAVMTLRYFGIPARYAEGYVITGDMVKNAVADDSIEVTSANAAAWAEVYQDGLGWIPAEVTAGIERVPVGTGDGEGDGKGFVKEPEEGKELEEEPQTQLEEPQPDGGYMVSLPEVAFWGGLILLAVLIVLACLLLVRHSLLLKKKKSRFEETEPNEAVAWMFQDAALLLEKMGICRGTGSMMKLIEPIYQKFGESYAKEYETAVRLNAQALFSSRKMTEEQRLLAKAFHESTVQYLKSGKKWYQRLWIQWILCLY